MTNHRKPSIVFVHGLWADGSCFSKLIPTLVAEGHEVIASQHGLDSHAEDVACVRRTLKRVSSPAVLVGHAYGGSVITAAGTDSRVAALAISRRLRPTRMKRPRASRISWRTLCTYTMHSASPIKPGMPFLCTNRDF